MDTEISLREKFDDSYVVQTDDIIPLLSNASEEGVSVTPEQIAAGLTAALNKSHGGRVQSNGNMIVASTGMSVVRSSVGIYTITHDFGHINYSPTVTLGASGTHNVSIQGLTTSGFDVLVQQEGGSLIDFNFNFSIIEWT